MGLLLGQARKSRRGFIHRHHIAAGIAHVQCRFVAGSFTNSIAGCVIGVLDRLAALCDLEDFTIYTPLNIRYVPGIIRF